MSLGLVQVDGDVESFVSRQLEFEEVVAGRAVVVRRCAQIAEGAICDDGS